MLDDVAVVTVAYRSAQTIADCVESVRGDVADIVVVDNASPDESATVATDHGARVIRLDGNRGFGAGCNAGVAATSAPFVLLLNPDAAVTESTVSALREELHRHARVAIVASELRNDQGDLEPSRRRFPTAPRTLLEPGLAARLDERHYARRQPRGGPVDWVTAACALVRREAFDAVGGFDESYFLYAEEIDLAMRLRQRGWEIRWVPGHPCRHASGASSTAAGTGGKGVWAEGFLRYTELHAPHPRAQRWALLAGCSGRMVAWTLLRRPASAAKWREAAKVAAAR